ncbi:hypothetical protein ACSQ6I_19030 [Anabaena sp. WFMT]|uniref:hypothetical protein n=1 Tax=Anabaena sp. WFMT TaxID=3449730 RepID=UPI003F1F576F
MLFYNLHNLLITPINNTFSADGKRISKSIIFCLIGSIIFSIFYSCLGLKKAFQGNYVVQDDAREYVFWMQRFSDSELLPNDLIADYFKSITPIGYASVYKLMTSLGIEPVLFSKILPIFLGLIITIYCFYLSLEFLPVPSGGFISTLLLNQSLWFKDDLVSATPRAFIYPLLLAFLYYLLRENRLMISLIIVLEGFLYPPLLFISLGILIVRVRKNYLLLAGYLGLGIIAMLPYALTSSEFGPVVTAAQAWQMPEHWTEGRHPFFDQNPWRFWLIGQHSGILPPLMPPLIWFGLFFPWVLKSRSRFPLVSLINKKIILFKQVTIVSLVLYFAAHIVLLKLFFPTRYTVHTFRIIMALAGGITFTVMLDGFFHAYQQKRRFWQLLLTATLMGLLLFYPNFLGRFPTTGYKISEQSAIYEFLQKQPKNIMIATLSDEADYIPTFGKRSILVGREYALPFHLGYYGQIRQRTIDLLYAQYSQDLAVVQQVIQKYRVTFWLLERTAFQPEYLTQKTWLKSFQPAFTEAVTSLEQGINPALAQLQKQCSVLETEKFTLLKADCLLLAKLT